MNTETVSSKFIIEGSVPADESERLNLNRIERARALLEHRKPNLIRPNPLRLARETVDRIRNVRGAKKRHAHLLKVQEGFKPRLAELQAEIVRLNGRLDRMDYEGSAVESMHAVAEDRRLLEAANELLHKRYIPHNTSLHLEIREAAEAAGIAEIQQIRGVIADDKRIAAERLAHASQSGADLMAWEEKVDNADLEQLEAELAAEEAAKPGKRMPEGLAEIAEP